MKKTKTFTISEKYNSFLWLPSKTASTTLSWIMTFFEFDLFEIRDEKLIKSFEGLTHFGHDTYLPPNHETMTFICSIRNPYERFFSFFKLRCKNNLELLTKENFKNFLDIEFYNISSTIYKSKDIFDSRLPDYVIRTENLYGDLTKIPYILESKLYQTGILQDMCNMKKHKSFDVDFEHFFTDEYKELIFNQYEKHFILGGYKK